MTIVGGGDTGNAMTKLGFENSFYHLSTGGSACLEFIRGFDFPALERLAK